MNVWCSHVRGCVASCPSTLIPAESRELMTSDEKVRVVECGPVGSNVLVESYPLLQIQCRSGGYCSLFKSANVQIFPEMVRETNKNCFAPNPAMGSICPLTLPGTCVSEIPWSALTQPSNSWLRHCVKVLDTRVGNVTAVYSADITESAARLLYFYHRLQQLTVFDAIALPLNFVIWCINTRESLRTFVLNKMPVEW